MRQKLYQDIHVSTQHLWKHITGMQMRPSFYIRDGGNQSSVR